MEYLLSEITGGWDQEMEYILSMKKSNSGNRSMREVRWQLQKHMKPSFLLLASVPFHLRESA